MRRSALVAGASAVALVLAAAVPAAADSPASFRVLGDAWAVQAYQGPLASPLVFPLTDVVFGRASSEIDSSPFGAANASLFYPGEGPDGGAESLAQVLADVELSSSANPTPVRRSPVDISQLEPYNEYAQANSGERPDARGTSPAIGANVYPVSFGAGTYTAHADASPGARADVSGGAFTLDAIPGQPAPAASASAFSLRSTLASILAGKGYAAQSATASSTPIDKPYLDVRSELSDVTSSLTQDGSAVQQSSTSTLHGITLLGGLVSIDSIVVATTGSTDGTHVPAPARGQVRLSGVSVAGMAATIDARGIHLQGAGESPDVLGLLNQALGQGLAAMGVTISAGEELDLVQTRGLPRTHYQENGLVVTQTIPGSNGSFPSLVVSLGHADLLLGAEPAPQGLQFGGSGFDSSAFNANSGLSQPSYSSGDSGGSLAQAVGGRLAQPPRFVLRAAEVLPPHVLVALAAAAEILMILATLLAWQAARRARRRRSEDELLDVML